MITDNIPEDIRDYLGDIADITISDQGLTSDVTVISSRDKKFILKHSTGKCAAYLRCEHQVLRELERTDVPVARVHQFMDTQSGDTDSCWMLAEYVPGESLTARLSDPNLSQRHRYNLFRNIGAALAVMHATPPPSYLNDHRNVWLDTLISWAGTAQEERALIFDKDPRETQVRRENVLRVGKARPEIESFTLIHGDCGTGHILFDGTTITGVIDWGCATIGDPRYDIAQILCVPPEWATKEIDDDVKAFFEGYGTPSIPIEIIRYYQELYEMGGGGCIQNGG